MPGERSPEFDSESVPEGAVRRETSEGSIVFLVGSVPPHGSGAVGQDGGREAIMSEIVDAGGTPIDLAHDIVAARFDRVTDAVRVATRADRGTPHSPASGSPRRCWAVHATDARHIGGLDHLGAALRRATAMSAIGHAGQLLISDPAWSALVAQDDTRIGSVDLGVHRLGGLPRLERIWQLGGRRDGFPPLRSTDVSRHGLPSALSPLIGREDQVVEIRALLARERLVTLTGWGGVGKTRLALAGAAAASSSFERTCWVDLSSVVEPHDLFGAILEAAGLWRGVELPLAALVDEFDRERVLLTVDNCEHLVDAVAELFRDLLANAHGLVVLATSRQPIGLPGEVTYRVPALVSPPEAQAGSISVADAAKYSAVQLFVDRATRVHAGFRLDDHTAPFVASLCHRLDGIPLAIEIVAAHVRHLPVEHIADEVNGPLQMLGASPGGTVARHDSITASIDWSYDRLDPTEQRLLRCVAVFADPCPLEAVVDVFGATGESAGALSGSMNRLCDKNLVVSESGPTGPEYRMLHLVRAYALDRERDAGDLVRVRNAHADWWTRWIESRASATTSANLAAVDRYFANLLSAMQWVVDRPLPGLRLLTSLAKVSQDIGHARDVVPLARRLLTMDVAKGHPAEWLSAASEMSLRYDLAGSHEERQEFARQIRRVAEFNNDDLRLAIADFQLGDGKSVCESLQRHAIAHDELWIAALAATIAAQYDAAADPRTGLRTLDDAESFSVADELTTSLQHRIRGRIARDLGRFDEALTYADRLTSRRSELMIENAVTLMSEIGLLTRDRGLVEEALAIAERSLHGHDRPATRQRLVHVVRLIEGSEASWVDHLLDGDRPISIGRLWLLCREAIDAGSRETAVRRVDEQPTAGPFQAAAVAVIKAAATGDASDAHEALRIAAASRYPLIAIDALEQLGVVAYRSDRLVEAARLLGAAHRARTETRYLWRYRNEQHAVEEAQHATVHSGDEVLVAAFVEGSAISITEAAEYARRTRGERHRPRHGWEALTPTELRVIELVAGGLTNIQVAEQLLMSRSTVKTHLEHIYTKTGLHNRTELAAETTRRASTES